MGIRKDAADERFGSTTATTDTAKGERAGCLQGEGINTGRYAVTINHVKNSLRQAASQVHYIIFGGVGQTLPRSDLNYYPT